jgi:hypothetical protein
VFKNLIKAAFVRGIEFQFQWKRIHWVSLIVLLFGGILILSLLSLLIAPGDINLNDAALQN